MSEPHDDGSLPNPWHTSVGEVLEELVSRGTVRRQHGLAMLEAFMETSMPWEELPEDQKWFFVGRLEWWPKRLTDRRDFVRELIQCFAKATTENKAYVQECLRRAGTIDKGQGAKILPLKPEFSPPESLSASLVRLDDRLAFYDSHLVWHQTALQATLSAIYVMLLVERVPGKLISI
jgi:hypothetical protein